MRAIIVCLLLAGCAPTAMSCPDDFDGRATIGVYIRSNNDCVVAPHDTVIAASCDAEMWCGYLSATCDNGIAIDIVDDAVIVTVDGCEVDAHVTTITR